MSKTKTNDPGAHHASSGALIRRFLPYLANYKMVLCLDLFCAALTTLCDIVLPKIMSIITNSAMGVGITLTAGIVLKLAAVYFVLRLVDGAASFPATICKAVIFPGKHQRPWPEALSTLPAFFDSLSGITSALWLHVFWQTKKDRSLYFQTSV